MQINWIKRFIINLKVSVFMLIIMMPIATIHSQVLSGKIVDQNNKALSGCVVSLTQEGASDTTKNGDFKISTQSVEINKNTINRTFLTFEKGTVNFYLLKNTQVSAILYDIAGKAIFHAADKKFSQGQHSFKLSPVNHKLPAGVYYLRVRMGNATYVYSVLNSFGFSGMKTVYSSTKQQSALAKKGLAPLLDTLVVQCTGLPNKKIPLTKYAPIGTITIHKTPTKILYVDKDHSSASNSNDGSQNSPWLTIQHAVNQLKPGNLLYVKAASQPYFEPYRASGNDKGGITIDVSGTLSQRIRIEGFPGGRPIVNQKRAMSSLSASDGSPDASSKILTGFYIRKADYITIKNFEITQTSTSGIMLHQYGENELIIIEDNYIHHLYGEDNVGGVRLDNCNNCIVRNNLIHDTYSTRSVSSNPYTNEPYSLHSGIHGYRPGNCIIENNTIYNVAKGVFQKSPDPELLNANTVRYNLFYNNNDAAFVLGVQGAGSPQSLNSKFYGNIVYDSYRGIKVLLSETDIQSSGIKIFNNTFYNITESSADIKGYHGIEFYNNIVANIKNFNFVTADATGPPEGNTNEIDYLDNNLYFNHANHWLLDRYGASNSFKTFSDWQKAFASGKGLGLKSNPDANSKVADPLFNSVANKDFRVQATSPAKGLGRNQEDIGADGLTAHVGVYPKR